MKGAIWVMAHAKTNLSSIKKEMQNAGQNLQADAE